MQVNQTKQNFRPVGGRMRKVFTKFRFSRFEEERGSTIVLALLVLTLLGAFVILAVNRATNETIAITNDIIETRTFAAAEASLEVMTREFDKIFERKLSPDPDDLQRVRMVPIPGFGDYDFNRNVVKTKDSTVVDLTGTFLKGLKAIRDEWMFETVTTDRASGVQVGLRRWIYNNRIPLFQFGVFYNGDLEFYPGPPFQFGGRVHSNGNIFFMAINGLWFSSKISAHKYIITDVLRNGFSVFDQQCRPNACDKVYIKDATGNYVQLKYNMGSLVSSPSTGSPVLDSTYPRLYHNNNWNSYKYLFQGNLISNSDSLNLPLVIAGGRNIRYIDLIKRSKNVGDLHNVNGTIVPVTPETADNLIVKSERYANKKGIRITLDDEQRRLPGCANATGQPRRECGVQLAGPGNDGYQPIPMNDGRQATRVNGIRLRGGPSSGRQVWIKIELVDMDGTKDVTEDILSLGVTEPLDPGDPNDPDSRSIVKLQRFYIQGVEIAPQNNRYLTFESGGINPLNGKNFVIYGQNTTYSGEPTRLDLNGRRLVPFPIKMFDTREGLYNDDLTDQQLAQRYPNGTVPWAGVMSVIDIDIANLRKFLMGDFDAIMPQSGTLFSDANRDRNDRIRKGLTAADVPEARGWVLYISDRRGDRDFDGQYDMEDVYPDNVLSPLEDVNDNGRLDVGFGTEAPRYADYDTDFPSCVVIDHSYYRRAVRLINGALLPGKYDRDNPANTKGFTVASENAVYVQR